MKHILLGSIVASSLLYADSSVYELGRIEVVDTNETSLNKTTTVVDAETIKDTESRSVAEALQFVPGVTLEKTGRKNLTEVRIRGFEGRRVPIFIDGIPVYVPYNRETDLGRYTTNDVSEITVSKAYVSPMFGPNTMAGAVNVVTKKPTKEFEGEIGVGAFNGNGHEEFLTLGTNQGTYYGLLSVSNYEKDYERMSKDFDSSGFGDKHWEDGGKRENSASKNLKINVKAGYTPNDTDEYALNFIMQRAEKGSPYYAAEEQAGSKSWRTRNWDWPQWDKTSLYFNSTTNFDEFTFKTRLFYDKFENELQAYDGNNKGYKNTNEWFNSKYDDYSFGGSGQLDYRINDAQTLKTAYFQKHDHHKSIDDDSPDVNMESITRSLGLEHSWQITNRLKWVVGLSYDMNNIEKAEYRDGDKIGNWGNHNTKVFSPQTALYFDINNDTTIYGAISRRSNLPTLSNRYSNSFGEDAPNPSLDAEIATTYELGLEHKIGYDHFIKTAIFNVKTDDYIAGVEVDASNFPSFCTEGEDCQQYQNIGQEEHTGFELSVESYWNDSFSTNISYTFIDSELKKAEDPNYKNITDVPEHSLSLRAKYSPIEKLAIVPSIHFETEKYFDVEDDYQTDSFVVMDFQTTYKMDNGIEVTGGINNLFDKDYSYRLGYPEEGRNFYAKMRYKF